MKQGSKDWKKNSLNLEESINDNLNFLIQGINKYNSSQVRVYNSPRKIVAQIGSTKLYHYGGKGTPIVYIPSHINKPNILDLNSEQSLIKKLNSAGLNQYVIDWGNTNEEKNFNFEDYFNQRLTPLLNTIHTKEKKKAILVGYCMGGLFAISASKLLENLVSGLITIATPWNFHSMDFLVYPFTIDIAKYISNTWCNFPYIPKELIQLIFYFLRYPEINIKYINIGSGKTKIREFIDVENWANDGLDMSTPLFSECMRNLIVGNLPYYNNWKVNNVLISLNELKQKSFCILSLKDKISPFTSTLPIAVSLKNCTIKSVNSGHIGMIINDKYTIASDLIHWIKSNFA